MRSLDNFVKRITRRRFGIFVPSPKNRTCDASAVFGYISLTARGIFAQQCPASRATLVLRAATIFPRADRALSLFRKRKRHARRSSYLEASSDAFFVSARRRSTQSFHISASKQSGKLLESGHANAAGAYLIHHKPEGRIQNIKYQYEQNKHHDACQTPEKS